MEYIKEIIKGMLIGVANVMPGVSGGTLAVSLGVYDKLIRAVTHIVKDTKNSFLTLLPYGIGAALGLAGLSLSIEYLFETWPLQTSLTFIGLILGGLPVLAGKVRGRQPGAMGYGALLALFSLALITGLCSPVSTSSLSLSAGPEKMALLFAAGAVAAAAMVIPGVSGSMLLMMMGVYQPVITSVNRFIRGAAGADVDHMLSECAILIPFGIGVAAGGFACARLVEWLLSRWETISYCAVIGLVAASPPVILSSVPQSLQWGPGGLTIGLICFASAFAFTVRLGRGSEAL